MKPTLLSLLFSSFVIAHISFAAKPNVIFILADDLGIGNVGCYGADNYKTPYIDQLAAQGTRFTHCFTAALCGPSRALIMSGRYAFRNGATNQDACTRMDAKEIVMPKLFKTAGYATACVGKWGQLPGEPGDHGFDDWLRFNGSGVYWNPKGGKSERYAVNGEEKKLGDKEFMPDVCHDHVVRFIQRHRDEPFFVYYPMSSVHGDLMLTPDSAPESKDLMADNIAYMDKLVGKLITELETLKLREKTIIYFMGDNGTGKGQSDRATIGGKVLSGMKGTMLECGGLVPMIANWPGKMPGGKVCDDLIDSTDFVATFAELTGARLPEKIIFDGHSIVPQLLGESAKPREWVFNELARMWYVRDAKWKLNEKGELFDMSGAPFTEPLVTTDTPESTAARSKLSTVLATLNPAGGILDEGDGSGRHAKKDKKKNAEPVKKPESSPQISLSSEEAERGDKFDKIDKGKTGKLTREDFIASQSDSESAGKRFDKYDSNKDGLLSRDEFVFRGAK